MGHVLFAQMRFGDAVWHTFLDMAGGKRFRERQQDRHNPINLGFWLTLQGCSHRQGTRKRPFFHPNTLSKRDLGEKRVSTEMFHAVTSLSLLYS